jgi:5-methylthioadenosine/S-adenosylhomocysteine deaminase
VHYLCSNIWVKPGMANEQNILIEKGTIITLDDGGKVYPSGYVQVRGDRIAALGSGEAPLALREASGTILDASHMAVLPGMVNSHSHLFQSFIRGLADDKPLLDWLKSCIWPVAEHMTGEECELAGMVGLIENLRSGATTVIDHQYIHADPTNDDGVVRAAEKIGVRLLLARGWADMNYHPALMETPERIISETTRLFEQHHGKAQGRIRVEFGPLIPWGCSDEMMLRTYALAQEWGVGTHIHVAETKVEVDMNLETRGKRHVEWLADLGILGPDVQLVHSVWLDDHELDLVAEHAAVVVHCPVSNMYLASGSARIRDMRRRGIHVALASDGPGSNNNQNMMEVLKTTALLAKVSTMDPMAVFPQDVLGMACRGGALAFGQPEWIGSLEVGKKADIVLVDLDSPFAMPVHNPVSALVYNLNCGAVDTVLVDGQVLMKNKQVVVVDEKAVLEEARSTCEKLFKRAGVLSKS